ncbi:MAG: hypothetical protein RRZ24_09850 [Clostridia bacterium]
MELDQLVARIRRGDKSALKELIAACGANVYQKAYAKTQDANLAREATRQTFSQFVAKLQEQPESNGWNLWLDTLAIQNIQTYDLMALNMARIEDELDKELFYTDPTPSSIQPTPPSVVQPPPVIQTPPVQQPLPQQPRFPGYAQPSSPAAQHSPRARQLNNHVFDEMLDKTYCKKNRHGSGWSAFLLIVLCLLLIWVVSGVAMSLHWIPFFDLGYTWFNAAVFRFF